jgi:hypothetical protein
VRRDFAKRITIAVTIASVTGCATVPIPPAPALVPTASFGASPLQRFQEEEATLDTTAASALVAGENVELLASAGSVRVAGRSLTLDPGAEPRYETPAPIGTLAAGGVIAGLCAIPALRAGENETNKKLVWGGVSLLFVWSGIKGAIDEAKKRNEEVRYQETTADHDTAPADGAPFLLRVRSKGTFRWTGGQPVLERVQVRIQKSTTPQYEETLKRARTLLEKGDLDKVRQALRPYANYSGRDPELADLLSAVR